MSTLGNCFVFFTDRFVIFFFFSNFKGAPIWPQRDNVTSKILYIVLGTDIASGEAISKFSLQTQ